MRTPKLICFAVSAILAVTAAFADRLNPGQSLAVGGSITSPDGRFTLVLQADGNLVLYQSGGVARWATGTVGRTVSQAVMQADGNFVLYGPAGPIWATATDGHPGAYLAVQDDGNVVIYGPGGPLWASRKNYVRRSINSLAPNGPEIAALRRGFQVMQSRQPSDHTSLIYQANMHGTVDRPLLADWETCQHGSFFFLSWHRMYLYYLERILRAASGDPYLSLPYWNYSDGADPNARALPLPFRQPQNAT